MRKLLLLIILFCAQVTLAQLPEMKFATPYGKNAAVGKFADVNGIKMYYEVYGQGKPLLLIHGNGQSIIDMGFQIDFFSKYYKCIVADSRGHGRSGQGQGRLTYEQMADDWSALLDQLKIDSAYVIGWSDGGILSLLLAIHHPVKVSKLAAMGANLRPDSTAVYPWAFDMIASMNHYADSMIAKGNKSYDWELMRKRADLLGNQPHIPVNDLHKISAPALIMAGDKDVIREEHTVEIYQNILKAHLAIFPGQTHMIPITDPELFNATVYKFLKNPFTRPDTRDFLE